MTESFSDVSSLALTALADAGISAYGIVILAGGIAVLIVLTEIFVEWLEGRHDEQDEDVAAFKAGYDAARHEGAYMAGRRWYR